MHGGPNLTRIWITLRKNGAGAEMLIQDDGIGIPEDRHIEALSRFFTGRRRPWRGLGLAIAARVMKNHGGQLSILPSPRGAKIKLSLLLRWTYRPLTLTDLPPICKYAFRSGAEANR